MDQLSSSSNGKRRRRRKSTNELYKPKSTQKMLFTMFIKLVVIGGVIAFLIWAFEGTLLGWNDYTRDVMLPNAGHPAPIEIPK